MISCNVLSCKYRKKQNKNVSKLYLYSPKHPCKKAVFIFVIQLYAANLAERMCMYIAFMALSLQRITYDLFV